MAKKTQRFLSLLLFLAIITSIIPTEALAAKENDTSASANTISIDDAALPDELTADDVVGEVKSLRTAETKHFKLEDGSYIAVQYETDIHYKDSKGKWQDIDNGLVSNSIEADVIDNYTIKRNNLDINISASSEEKTDLEVNNNKYSVSFNMIGASAAEAKVEDKEKIDDSGLASALELPNISSTVTYAGIQSGVDLQYTMYGNDVKETIVINEKQDNYTYSFNLNLENLKPVANKDGSISLEDNVTGEPIYLIPAPYMFDAADSYSTDVYYKLEEKSKGEYVLTIAANNDWINDSNRLFPVKVDPT